MEKVITIGDKEIKMKATAGTPRLYRMMFRRDLMSDMARLSKSMQKQEFDVPDLETFENVAYLMAKQADAQSPGIDEWFDEFEIFDIYQVLPQILSLWSMETETQIESKKNLIRTAAK